MKQLEEIKISNYIKALVGQLIKLVEVNKN